MIRLLVPLLLLALAACSGDAPNLRQFGAACTVVKHAELPLKIDRNFMLAPVWLDNTGAYLIVDTGAEATVLTPESAGRLALARDPDHRTTLLGVSGPVASQNVTLRELKVGAITKTDLSLAVSSLSAFPPLGLPVAGLLGDDLLSKYDIELDIPDRRLALYEVRNCDGFRPDGFAAWHHAFDAVPALRTQSGLTFPQVRVDGHNIRALLDSGARTSLITRQAAVALGITPAALERDPARSGQGVGLGDIEFRLHEFDAVAVGGAAPQAMALNVADMRLPVIEMLLGADWLADHRVWIPARGAQIFVQPP